MILPLLAITLIIYFPFLKTPAFLLERHNDLTEFFWPIYYFVKNEILAGRGIPLWNPYFLSGTPLLPDPQAPIFYLPNLVFLILPVNTAFIISLFLHTFLGGLFFYLLLNSGFKFSRLSSLISAFLYITSPKLASYLEAGHVGLVYAWTWVPLAALAVKKLIDKPDIRFSFILSIALAFLFFSHTLIFIFSCLALVIFYLLSDSQKPNMPNIKFLGLGFILTFGLIAISFLPQIEWQKDTTRYLLLQIRDVYPKWNGKKEFLKALTTPWLGGINNIWKFDTEKFITLGILPTLLAILGFLKLDNKKKIILGGSLITITLISLNNLSSISQLFLKLDFFVLTRVATRSWFLVIIITTILVSYGLEKSRNRFRYLIAVLAIGESLFLSHKILTKPISPPTTAPNEVYEFLSSDKDRFRVFCTTRCLSQKKSVVYNLELIDGYSTLIQKNYNSHAWQLTGSYWNYYTLSIPPIGAFTFENLQPGAKPLGEYNTKYVISSHPMKDKNFFLVKKIDKYLIYQNQLFQPRSPTSIISYAPNHIRIDTSNFKEKSLTISEVYSPGWKAYLNGTSEVAVQETPEHKRFIDLSPNTKFVDLKYQPNSYKTGKAISIITILTLLLLPLGNYLNRKISFFKNITTFNIISKRKRSS